MGNIIGVDIGGTNIRIGVVNEHLKATYLYKFPQEEVLRGEDTVADFAVFLEQYIKENCADDEIDAIAIGIPAAMSRDRTTVLNAPNIRGFSGRNVQKELQIHFSFPIFLERDVSMLFHFDLHCRKIGHKGIIMGCYIGTGLGNVISIDGKLLKGRDGVACELGHIPVWDKRELCNCGNIGCMESYVGGKYLVHLQQEKFPETPIGEIFEKHAGEPEIEAYLEHLALPIATEITILNPDLVILGGGIISMHGFSRKRLEEYIYIHTRKPLPAEQINIIYSEDCGENGVIGCALYAQSKLGGE